MVHHTAIIFDLDDTLYKEEDFLLSAFQSIACRMEQTYGISGALDCLLRFYRHQQDAFGNFLKTFNLPVTKSSLIQEYRSHFPLISLPGDTERTLSTFKGKGYILGLITDGRTQTQKNKIEALQLDRYFAPHHIIISEEFGSAKPDLRNYTYFERLHPGCRFVYVGDNPEKDFIAPNTLGWTTVCLLDNGRNIHTQQWQKDGSYLPAFKVAKLSELLTLIDKISS